MIEYIVLTLILFSFIIASLEDIKKREVYDYINYSLAFFISIIAVFNSIFLNSLDPVKYVGFGLLAGFAFGSLFYYMGVWGGGDAKFLIGFSASTYYLMKFITQTKVNLVINNLFEIIAYFFSKLLIYLEQIVIVLNIIFFIIFLAKLIYSRKKSEHFDLVILILILSSLFLGIYLNYSGFILILLGLFALVLLFFADENIFNLIYFLKSKKISELKEGDFIDESIKKSNKTIINENEAKFGLSKSQINKIEETFKNSTTQIKIRYIIPFSLLIILNYVVYLLKIITLDKTNLAIIAYQLEFLFYSFAVGGVIAILLLLYFYIKNFKKVKFNLTKIEKIALSSITLLSLILAIYDSKLLLLIAFPLIYLFMKIARDVEHLMFVSKKPISKIVPGDWIVQDIIVNKKMVYSVEDFTLGIDDHQLEILKELAKTNKNLKKIYVKDGLAFLPPLFIGFLIILLI